MDELLPIFEREELQLRLEPHPDDFVEDGRVAADMVRGIDSLMVTRSYTARRTRSTWAATSPGSSATRATCVTQVHVADSFDLRASTGCVTSSTRRARRRGSTSTSTSARAIRWLVRPAVVPIASLEAASEGSDDRCQHTRAPGGGRRRRARGRPRVAEIAAAPVQEETIDDCGAITTACGRSGPMAMIDEIPWHEMDVGRRGSRRARRTRSAGARDRAPPDALPLDPHAGRHGGRALRRHARRSVRHSGFGVGSPRRRRARADGNPIVAHHYEDRLATEDDVARLLRARGASWTSRCDAPRSKPRAHESLDGILDIRMQGWNGVDFALWDDTSSWRDRDDPVRLHRPARVPAPHRRPVLHRPPGSRARHPRGEGAARLRARPRPLHGRPTRPSCRRPGFDPARPRAIDNWIAGRAQLFGIGVDAMFEEFVVPVRGRATTSGSASATSGAATRSTTGSTRSAGSPTCARSR